MAKKERPNRSAEILRGASEHLFYEVDMLIGTVTVRSKTNGVVSGYISNALLESFVIHLRNILDFLYAGENLSGCLSETDLIAEDYLDGKSWRDKRPKKTDFLKQYHTRVHKEIAHLTYDRLSVVNKDWQFKEILSELVPSLQMFVEMAPDAAIDPRLRQVIQALR